MDLILSLIPGGSLTAIAAGVVAILAALWRAYATGRKSERNRQRAKEADSLEQSLKDLADASDARNRVRPDDELQHDPYNRDR